MNKYYIMTDEIEQFRNHLREDEKSESTVEKYVRDVSAFRAWSDDIITKDAVLAYKSHLTQRYAVRSVNSKIASLNAYFEFLGQRELRLKTVKLQRNPFCEADRELTKADYERLCRAAQAGGNRRLYLLLQTLGGTGIRVSELPYITVEAVNAGRAVVRLKGKTRTVLIVKQLKRKLLPYIRDMGIKSGAVFVTRMGKPLNRSNIWREMKHLCAAAGVDPRKVFPHNLRHLFARLFYKLDKDIAKLADILGHSSIETTRIYLVTTASEHLALLERMPLLE